MANGPPKWLIPAILLAHFGLLACYTFPSRWIPDRLRYWSITYARPLFHQGWDLFAPDPPRCSCELQVGIGESNWRELDAYGDHYLRTRMARNIAAYLNGGSPMPDTLKVPPVMEEALRGMVRDIGRELPDLRFRAVQRCVKDDRRPAERTTRYVPIVFVDPPRP